MQKINGNDLCDPRVAHFSVVASLSVDAEDGDGQLEVVAVEVEHLEQVAELGLRAGQELLVQQDVRQLLFELKRTLNSAL
jgi:hypothetical protein